MAKNVLDFAIFEENNDIRSFTKSEKNHCGGFSNEATQGRKQRKSQAEIVNEIAHSRQNAVLPSHFKESVDFQKALEGQI